ncbi:hypothetical protein PC129_g9912 [Phytophthora cactorum]|uniref:Uncharacterized protein n=1 Tax=Phytophthora cactorum TaxID=29920 RepID=A0A8T1I7Y9_9STRA|nr:hypothetical protein PC129_g9912 [Phytophthora cactorum]
MSYHPIVLVGGLASQLNSKHHYSQRARKHPIRYPQTLKAMKQLNRNKDLCGRRLRHHQDFPSNNQLCRQ